MVSSKEKVFTRDSGNELQGKYLVNEQIKTDKVFVIDETGQNHGLIPKSQALALAVQAELDLVQVGVKDSIPVTKIMDFGKFVYAKKKQLNDAKKHQKVMVLKEMKLRPHIGDQDFKTKMRQTEQFFLDGKRVKFTIQFKGREIGMMDTIGPMIFKKINDELLVERKIGTLVEEKEQRGSSYWSKTYFLKTGK
ncbi:MAG: translation initiation factor IF-3 [bacterium]